MTAIQTGEWPEGVIARCLTVGGATVDILDIVTHPRHQQEDHKLSISCMAAGCDWPYNVYDARTTHHSLWTDEEPDSGYLERLTEVRESAAGHAAKCRWMPKPGGGA